MAERKPKSKSQPKSNTEGITRITVGGFKSINQEQSIEIRESCDRRCSVLLKQKLRVMPC